LKKVSVTTPEPVPPGGLMKNAVKALQIAIVAYELLRAQPMLKARDPRVLISHTGLRPYRLAIGFQNRGAQPRMAIWSEVRYAVLVRETPNSSAIPSKAGMMADAVKVVIMAWIGIR
jgi:hypothetical protein